MEGPTTDWSEDHHWTDGWEFRLRVPETSQHREMMLPLWGWQSVRHCYRLSLDPIDIESIDRIHHDVFEADGGPVLVVATAPGTESARGDDRDETSGARVWEAPARTAEPPRHLVDEKGRRAVEDWLFDAIAPVEVRWTRRVGGRLEDRVDAAGLVEFEELPTEIRAAVDDAVEDFEWGLEGREVDLEESPSVTGRFSRRDTDLPDYATGFEAEVAGESIMVVFTADSSAGSLSTSTKVAWADEVDSAVDEYGEDRGLLRVLARRAYDRFGASSNSAVGF